MLTAPPLNESALPILSVDPAPVQLRSCNGCHREFPLESYRFRHRATGERHYTCNDCFNRYRREKRAPRIRRNDLSKSVTALASTERRDDVQLLAAVVRQMTRRFGGLDRMCELWATNVTALANRRPGGRLIVKTFQAIIHLSMAVEAAERAERNQGRLDLTKLNSGELGELIVALLDKQLGVQSG